MNYGYQPPDPDGPRLELSEADEPDRYSIQLYHRVAAAAGPLEGKDVLEVGSGRGGGASYVHRYLKPRKVVAADFSRHAVDLANRRLGGDGLTYVEGDAEKLPFEADSFDVVLNVESSHCYPSRPGSSPRSGASSGPGACSRSWICSSTTSSPPCRASSKGRGSMVESVDDVSSGVVEGLRLDGPHREAMIAKNAPKALAPVVKSFAGTEGSDVYNSLQSGRLKYVAVQGDEAGPVRPGLLSDGRGLGRCRGQPPTLPSPARGEGFLSLRSEEIFTLPPCGEG